MNPIKIRLRIYLIIFFAVMICGTLGFMIVEDLSPVDALYFSIVTIATVGYGDIHPATQPGKLFAIFLIITGVGTFLGVIANATELMLQKRETQARMEKMNMVIGTFYSEVGLQLLSVFTEYDPKVDIMREELIVTEYWTDEDFLNVSNHLKRHKYAVEINKVSLEDLKSFLLGKRDFLLRLLENPVLLEHETFTELLRAVFHLTEELSFRDDIDQSPHHDKMHIATDIKRSYNLLVDQWLAYMKHLKDNYPYLFSLAMRTNPFDQKASPVIES
jgi:voltage-gated potassium channel